MDWILDNKVAAAQPAGNLPAGLAAAAGAAVAAGILLEYPAADLTFVHLVEKFALL